MTVATAILFALICSQTFASQVRSSGSCFGSGTDRASQYCGQDNFYCPVDETCKSRSVRCTSESNCWHYYRSEINCYKDDDGNGYTIRLGKSSLISKKKQHEFEHQFIVYRGFTYEFGCNYGLQILDLNDPINYKYEGISVTYQTKGTSWCTYDETIIFTKALSRKYDILTNNCQHFARELTKYLTTAHCGSTRSTDLENYANDLVEGCTDCCEPVSDASTTTTATWMMMIIIILPSLLT